MSSVRFDVELSVYVTILAVALPLATASGLAAGLLAGVAFLGIAATVVGHLPSRFGAALAACFTLGAVAGGIAGVHPEFVPILACLAGGNLLIARAAQWARRDLSGLE